MDTQRIRQLLDDRDRIDRDLAAAFNGNGSKKPVSCSHCNQEGHTARTCPQKAAANTEAAQQLDCPEA